MRHIVSLVVRMFTNVDDVFRLMCTSDCHVDNVEIIT